VTFMASLDGHGGPNELYVSPQIEAMLGFSQQEWLEDPVLWFRQLHREDRERWNVEFAPTVSQAEPFRSVYRFVARDGRVVWVRGDARVVKDDAGRPLYLQGVAFDITAIKEAEEEVKRLNQTLNERVKERTAEAEQRAHELAQSNAKLKDFAYVAAHDLREPLRSIGWDVQKLQQQCLGEEAREPLGYIIEGVRLMDRLIQELSDYSRAGQEGTAAPVDCDRVFQRACGNLRAALTDAGAAVTADPLPTVLGVETELVQLIQNLIGNAVKFRKPDRPAQVHVGARRQGGEWLFWVRDNGIGIKEKHLERIFGVGQKSRVHPRSKYPGTGFGLAICKKIVESRGGSIRVESQFDQGSTFYFTLPAAAEPGALP